jgi:hypothetical protein
MRASKELAQTDTRRSTPLSGVLQLLPALREGVFGDRKATDRADAEPDCRQEEEGQEEYRPAET